MIDLAERARGLMEIAKNNLLRDGYLTPYANVVCPGREIHAALSFVSNDSKYAAYKDLAKIAKRHRALAIIAVNDIYYKKYAVPPGVRTVEEARKSISLNYHQGDLERMHAAEAIQVMVKSPGAPPWALMCPYSRDSSNNPVFHEIEEERNIYVGVIPDW